MTNAVSLCVESKIWTHRNREKLPGQGVWEISYDGQRRQTFCCKMKKVWGPKVEHGDMKVTRE